MATSPKQSLELVQTPALPGRMLIMPAAYLPKEKKKLSSTAILILVLVFVGVLVGIVVLLFVTRQTPSAPVVQAPIEETPVTPVTPEPTPTPVTPTPVTPQPVVPTAEIPAITSGEIPAATDTDQDSLSDAEETLFSTSASVPDTDQDSFLDGIELRNQYDPATPRALLEVSPRIKLARNDSLGYQLFVPVDWSASKNTSDGKQFLIRPNQGTESFRVDVYDNTDRLNVTEWFQQQQPNANLTQFVNFQNEAGWIGIQTQDHRLIVATLDDGGPGSKAFIFVMYYQPGEETTLRYSAIWDMMANSLAVAPRIDTTSSSNTQP